MGKQVAELYAKLDADSSGFEKGMGKMLGSLKGAGGALGVFKGQMLTNGVMAVLDFGKASINAALEYDRSMANISSVTGKTGDALKDLGADILAIGSNSQAGPQAAAAAYYDIAGGVADASTHMAILNAAIATSEAGQAELTSTTAGMIAAMNAYGFSAEQAGFVSDVFTRTVGVGVGSMDEFVSALSPLTGLAANVGVGFDELGGAMAFMTTKGTSASMSATQMKAAISGLLNPNATMTAQLRKMGIESGSAMLKQHGLIGALNMLKESTGGSTDQMAKMLGSVEALQGAVTLTGDDVTEFMANFEEGLTGATDAARQLQLDSVSAQFGHFQSKLEGLGIAVGGVLLPIVNAGLEVVTGTLDHFGMALEKARAGDQAGAWTELGNAAKTLGEGLLQIPLGIATEVGNFLGIDVNAGLKAWQEMGAQLPGIMDSIFGEGGKASAALAPFKAMWNQFWGEGGTVSKIKGSIESAFNDAKAWIESTGKALFEGAFSGVVNAVGPILAKLGGFITGAVVSGLRGLATMLMGLSAVPGAPAVGAAIYKAIGAAGFAAGGTMMPGKAAWVGEKGPELAIPGRMTTIIPNGLSMAAAAVAGSGRGGGGTAQVTLNAYGVDDPARLVRMVSDELRRRGVFVPGLSS